MKLQSKQGSVYSALYSPWQYFPVKPAGHLQVYPSALGTHVAPFRHSLLRQGSPAPVSEKSKMNMVASNSKDRLKIASKLIIPKSMTDELYVSSV